MVMRGTVTSLASAVAVLLLTVPLAADAQQAADAPRVGFICERPGPSSHSEQFERGLRELGYVPGQNVAIEYRFAPTGDVDPFPAMAAEMVRLNVDVIVVTDAAIVPAAKAATKAIPIVFAQSDDPVGSGFVGSLARPGGNITGLSTMSPEVSVKQLEFLRELVPRVSRVAVLWDSARKSVPPQVQALSEAARRMGVSALSVPVRAHPPELEQAVAAMRAARIDALIVMPDMAFFHYQDWLVRLVAQRRIPTIFGEREFVDAGGLISYGTDYQDLFRRAARYVHSIVKGAKPQDLPVEQPTKFELAVNLKAAKALGLTIPQPLLLRADTVVRGGEQPLIGVLFPGWTTFLGDRGLMAGKPPAFSQRLHELGHVDGQNVTIRFSSAEGAPARLPDLAASLVEDDVSVIVAVGEQAVDAARRATKDVPIVMAPGSDPVGSPLKSRAAKSGGNVTGLAIRSREATARRLEFIRMMAPAASRLALLWNPADPAHVHGLKDLETAARRAGLTVRPVDVREPKAFEATLRAVTVSQAEALVVLGDPFGVPYRAWVVTLATQAGLPAIYEAREFVESGGLIAYGPRYTDIWRRAANYVDQILKGSRPADLPIEQRAAFELVINLKTAKALGLTIPPSLLLRADHVIE
jgi:putative ABC transport system substrate-binding protein